MRTRQISFISKSKIRTEHGGSLLTSKRKTKRPLSINSPIHIVLHSDMAKGSRSLLKHSLLINRVIEKARRRFAIKVYELAVVSNHIHLVVKGKTRYELQNFFRVVAGHIAQEILRQLPLTLKEQRTQTKRANKFWQTRIYSRLVSWGKDYKNVINYVIQNTKEALGLIPYKKRRQKQSPFR